MNQRLPFFNWSLKKAQDTEPDSFLRARIHIVFIIIIFSLFKALIVIGIGSATGQWMQVVRGFVALVLYTVLAKWLLYRPSGLKSIAHIMLLFGLLLVWTNIFVYAHKINLLTVQFVFMIIVSSFYTLGNRFGVIYSVASIIPVMLFLALGSKVEIYPLGAAQEFASPGLEIIVVLNFVSLVIVHYLFFETINVNIREKERLNRQLQLSIAEANKLAESKSNFLSTMSHELRTPLNSVIGISELLLDDKPEERQKDNLKILQLSALDLLSLINNVLDFNKAESEKLSLEMVPFRLDRFMQDICSVLRVKADNKKLSLVLEIDEQIAGTTINSDPVRLSQVMYNLIGNAIKFTDNGSIAVKLDLVNRTEGEVEVLFSIADTGIGIAPDSHESIFELFAQADSRTIRKYGGTGLGLAIVKQVLALFNSSIQLESTPGKGARFFFSMSFAIAAESTQVETLENAEKPDLRHLKILVAEDDHINRMVLKKQLARLQIQPVVVENGQQAFDAFSSTDFDIILLDLHMPVLGGYDTIRKIRTMKDATKAGVYIIAFTASVTEQEEILSAGFNDFLYKPVNMNELRDKLEKISWVG